MPNGLVGFVFAESYTFLLFSLGLKSCKYLFRDLEILSYDFLHVTVAQIPARKYDFSQLFTCFFGMFGSGRRAVEDSYIELAPPGTKSIIVLIFAESAILLYSLGASAAKN